MTRQRTREEKEEVCVQTIRVSNVSGDKAGVIDGPQEGVDGN